MVDLRAAEHRTMRACESAEAEWTNLHPTLIYRRAETALFRRSGTSFAGYALCPLRRWHWLAVASTR